MIHTHTYGKIPKLKRQHFKIATIKQRNVEPLRCVGVCVCAGVIHTRILGILWRAHTINSNHIKNAWPNICVSRISCENNLILTPFWRFRTHWTERNRAIFETKYFLWPTGDALIKNPEWKEKKTHKIMMKFRKTVVFRSEKKNKFEDVTEVFFS